MGVYKLAGGFVGRVEWSGVEGERGWGLRALFWGKLSSGTVRINEGGKVGRGVSDGRRGNLDTFY